MTAEQPISHRSLFLPIVGGLTVLAWAALFLWEQSPYGRYLDHGDWTAIGIAASICRVIPAGPVVVPLLLYAAGWLLMLSAMMLPTTLPLLEMFRRLTADRRHRTKLVALLIAGYLMVWSAFGIAVHLVDRLLHEVVARLDWLTFNGWAVGAAVLVLAGAFQFSALKYRCLDKCRSPRSFIVAHCRGGAEAWHAFRLGIDHGAFCVGCCWAIMLLMFVVGTGNVGWMLVLGVLMALEKNVPWARSLSKLLGVALLAWAGAILLAHVI